MSELPRHSIREGIGHEGRATTVVPLPDLDSSYGEEFELPLTEAIERLQAALAEVPAEFRDSATLRVSGSGDYVHVSAEVYFTRPETDAEMADRRRWLQGVRDDGIARERREFERLKAKFQRTP